MPDTEVVVPYTFRGNEEVKPEPSEMPEVTDTLTSPTNTAWRETVPEWEPEPVVEPGPEVEPETEVEPEQPASCGSGAQPRIDMRP